MIKSINDDSTVLLSEEEKTKAIHALEMVILTIKKWPVSDFSIKTRRETLKTDWVNATITFRFHTPIHFGHSGVEIDD